MTRGKRIALRIKHKTHTNKTRVVKSSSSDKKLKRSNNDNLISLNLRKISPVRDKQHYEEVKNGSNTEKNEIPQGRIIQNKVQDEKLLISPIVLLEILSMDRIKESSIIKKLKASSVTKTPDECTDSIKKSSHTNLRKYAYNKTEIQNTFVTDKQICISQLESNTNTKQKFTNKLIDNSSTRCILKLSDNSVLDEQINDEDTDDLKIESTNKEILVEKDTLCPVNKNVKCDTYNKRHLKEQIDNKKKYFMKSTNLQEKSTENIIISINCKEQENCRDKHISRVKEIVNDFTEDQQTITDIQYAMDSSLSEEIQNLDKCFTEKELDEQKYNSTTENNKENLLGLQVNDELISITDNESIQSSKSEEVISDNVENDACNDDEDEEIIFYYINSANEVVKKIDVKRKTSSKISKLKDDKVTCSTLPTVDYCEENVSVSQPAINDSEMIINVKNQDDKNGSKRTLHEDKSRLTKEEKIINVYNPEIIVKGKTLDNQAANIEEPNVININQAIINKKNEKMDVNLPATVENRESAEIITINQTVNTAKDKSVIINAIIEKADHFSINQPIVTDNDEDMEIGHSEDIDKIGAINNNKPTVNDKDETSDPSTNTIKNIKIININEITVNKKGEICCITSPEIVDNVDTLNLNKHAITNENKDIDIDQLVTSEINEIADIDESVNTEKDETLNITQAISTEKNVAIDKNQFVITDKDKNINVKQAAVLENADIIKINQIVVFEKNKTNTVCQLVNTKNDNAINEFVTNGSDEMSMIGQHIISEKDRKINVNHPLIVENEGNINTNQFLITESETNINTSQCLITNNEKNTPLVNVKISNLNQSSNTKNTNIDEPVSTENNTCIEICQSPFIRQDNITNVNHTVIVEKCRTVESNNVTINEVDLVNVIKVEEVTEDVTDEIADKVNSEANLSDNNKTDVCDAHLINDNLITDSVINDNIKVEDVDIPQDEMVTESNFNHTVINNENISINSLFTQDITETDMFTVQHETNKNNDGQQQDPVPDSESTSNGSMDRGKAMFINFMEAYQRMKNDINAATSLLTLNGAFNDVNYADISSEILHISDDSGDEVMVLEKKKDLAIQKLSTVAAVAPLLSLNPGNSVNPVNPVRRKILLPNGGAVISASKLYGCGDGIAVREGNERTFPCTNCSRIYKAEANYKRHKKKCIEQVSLPCILCATKIKHKKSLVEHLRRAHRNQVMAHEIKGIVDDVIRGAYLRKNRKAPLSSSTIKVPEFVKLFCNKCGKIYDRIYSDYYRECETCSVPLLVFCQRCNKRSVVSARISTHLNGHCEVGQPIKCPHCNFVSSQRHHIYQHIEDAHKTVPSTNETAFCSKGCGRKFDRIIALRRHEKYCGTTPNLRCKFCKYKTRHRSAIKMHMQQHVLRNETDLTETNFPDSDSSDSNKTAVFSIDENSVKKLMEAYCPNCKEVVPMPPTFVNSCRICKTRLTFNCNRCYLVPSRSHSYRHVRVHVIRCHTEKIYKCNSCGRRFAYYYDYNYHTSNCDKYMSYQCNLCPYKSNLMKGLKGHMRRIHPNGLLEIHHCIKCLKNFSSKDTLQRHQRLFCGIDPNFSCAHCDFCTRSKFSLTRHIQNKHSEIFERCQFQCVYCQKVYNNLYAYDTHVIICPRKPK